VEQGVVGEHRLDDPPTLLDLGELAHALEVGAALGVEVFLGGPVEHEREHDLGEQDRLQVRLGRDRLGQPGVDVGRAGLGDDVALAVGSVARLDADDHLAVAGQPGQGRVDLAERQRPTPPEERVVVALQVVAVAGLALEQTEQSQGNAHDSTIRYAYTLRVYGACPFTRRG
jgi:hypothetical protein